MKTLEVTDAQYAVIQQLREEISEQVVGKYGFVRERDAIQFLIDNVDGDADLEIDLDADLDSSATDDVAASVGAAIDDDATPTDLEEVSYVEDESVAENVDGPDAGGVDAETDDDGAAADDDLLDEMMSLLETHDDKWSESDSADYRYSVELPDGTTEDVQTKDDVRALLFKNYR